MSKLKPCKTCSNEVAKSAKKCPHCGARLKLGFFMKGLIGFGALIILGTIIGALGDDSSTTAKTEHHTNSKKKPLSNVGVSSDVTIKVTGVESKTSVGNEYTKEKAQGVFKIVKVSITNGQKDAITVDANSFKLVDNQDREFTSSIGGQTALGIENGGNLDFFLKQLNPGLTQEGEIVFDVPSDAKGLVLKASGGMMGEEITLKVE